MATLAVAHWVCALQTDSLPPSVLNAGRRSIYNYIGCAIGGSNHPTVEKAHAALSSFFGHPTATVFGHNESVKTDAQHAALLNGIASHIHDYDDTHLSTIIHPTGPVASAVLAYAQSKKGVSGQELLVALIAGIEVECKLGLAVWPSHYDVGWHITSSTGSIGAAVAVGKLMELDEQKLAHAIGTAATQVTGLREMFGSDTKSLHPGRAAQNGLLAATLAEQGFTSSTQALEAKRGWANVVLGDNDAEPQLEKYLTGNEGLGKTWEIERNAFKPFPCGIVCHPAIDACIQLHNEADRMGLCVEDIESIEEKVHPLVIELTSRRKPNDGLEGKFSVFHGSAVAMLYGKAGPAEYADDVVTREAVMSLRDQIDAIPDQSMLPDEVAVTVKFKNGMSLQKYVEHAVGSLNVPMTDRQLTNKFIDQVALVLGEQAAKDASDIAWAVSEAETVSTVLSRL